MAQIAPPPVTRPLYEFPDPISPHLAAARAGVRFDLGSVRRWVGEHERALTFVETAGGLFSPLDAVTSNFDLVNAVRPALVVLIAPDRLGVLHEVASTVGLAAARGWPVDAVILSAPDQSDASTGTNADSLASLGIAHPVASFPRAAEDDPAALAAANLALDCLLKPALAADGPR
jgi:dethiobiotin synthetase